MNKIIPVAVVLVIGGFLYYTYKKKSVTAQPSPVAPIDYNLPNAYSFDPSFNQGHTVYRMEKVSTDNKGGTVETNLHLVTANYPTFTGGTFVNPGVLPPVRSYQIQSRKIAAGRFVNPGYLPAARAYEIQKGTVGPTRRREN